MADLNYNTAHLQLQCFDEHDKEIKHPEWFESFAFPKDMSVSENILKYLYTTLEIFILGSEVEEGTVAKFLAPYTEDTNFLDEMIECGEGVLSNLIFKIEEDLAW